MSREVTMRQIQRQLHIPRTSGVAVLLFAFALSASIALAPVASAQSTETPATPETPIVPETPAPQEPEVEVPAGEIPSETPQPEAPENEQSPAQAAPLLQMAPMSPTNNAELFWSWVIVQPEGQEPVAIGGYGFNLFRNGELISQGTLTADAVSFLHTAAQDGTYTLHVWVLPATPGDEIEHQHSQSVVFDRTGPVMKNDGIVMNGPAATPQLSTDETQVRYSWAASGPANGVVMSDASALNPQFTFSRDGRYTLSLTAFDALGNSTLTEFFVTYVVPFTPSPAAPLIPEDLTPAPINTYVRPQEVSLAVQRTTRVAADDTIASSTVESNARNAIIADSTPRTSREEVPVEPTVALAASPEGWKIFGLAWYWWLLVAAIIASAWLWTVRTLRLRQMQ